ncbi:hypothetical protein [Bremerella alba]|uniref:hypothetical protein n=1 Tax=Bremerella alba TaxID=980252 RepID=UPI001A95485C|nr:hypothetical protein [Bremerella alba]
MPGRRHLRRAGRGRPFGWMVAEGWVSAEETVVCLVTGTGFKGPASVESMLAPVACETVSLKQIQERVHATTSP